MIGKYIRSKCKSALLFLVYLGIFCLVAFLFEMPYDALIYAIVLCLFFALVFMIYSYARFRQRQEVLQDIRARIQFGPEQLPMPLKKNIRKLSNPCMQRLRRRCRKETRL